jgi:hypothetical protein
MLACAVVDGRNNDTVVNWAKKPREKHEKNPQDICVAAVRAFGRSRDCAKRESDATQLVCSNSTLK